MRRRGQWFRHLEHHTGTTEGLLTALFGQPLSSLYILCRYGRACILVLANRSVGAGFHHESHLLLQDRNMFWGTCSASNTAARSPHLMFPSGRWDVKGVCRIENNWARIM